MSEYNLHKQIANYLRLQYPNTVFTSDSSGIRLSIGNAKKMLSLKSRHKIPDLIIFEAKGGYNGLILELKDKTIYKKDGTLLNNPHVQAQAETLKILRSKGYYAQFAIGFNRAQTVIDLYMTEALKR